MANVAMIAATPSAIINSRRLKPFSLMLPFMTAPQTGLATTRRQCCMLAPSAISIRS
jgi:hypothetical protein